MSQTSLSPLTSRTFWEGQGLALCTVLAATMLRQLMSPLVHGEMPHIPFLAAVLVTALRGGLAAGATATALGAVAANWVFVGDFGRFAMEADDLWASVFFVLFGAAITVLASRLTAARQVEAELAARLSLVNDELQHRIKNIVAVIQSVVRQSSRTATSAAELQAVVEDRLNAMVQALRLLTYEADVVRLDDLLRRILLPFQTGEAIEMDGPAASVPGQTAIQLALLAHELATNATKYGALSTSGGRVRISWRVSTGMMTLNWVEEGGPPVQAPQRSGFGTRLVRSAVPGGEARIEYEPGGVVFSLTIEGAQVSAS